MLNNQLFTQGAHGFTLRDSESCLDMDSYSIYIYHICIHIYIFVRAIHVHGLHICIHYTRDKKVKEETKNIHRAGQSSPYWNVKILEIEHTFLNRVSLKPL